MSTSTISPVLIVGGSGTVGSLAASTLRRLHPQLPLAIAGRSLTRAQSVADSLGNATAVVVDLERRDLGLASDQHYSAVVPFVKDDVLHTLDFAQDRGIPYLSTSSGSFEMAPEVARYATRPDAAPILFASHWLAGVATLPTLVFTRDFAQIDTIRLGAVLDELDMGGPAAAADYERLTSAMASTQVLENGYWRWIKDEAAIRRFRRTDGVEVEGSAYSPLDVAALALVTGARSIRLDLHYGQSSHSARGEHFSTELIIEIEGQDHSGKQIQSRHEIVHPEGQAPVTAIGIAASVERLLGLDGSPAPRAGLYLMNTLLDPDRYLARLAEFGAQVTKR
ncbi:hypothetical protein HIV01_003450 [Lysobacter arenosi]|uniref:Saccharopine dehydrogenase n=1 Tax=Lysobacter arenosi TaxID=2795387 RepID=A0ABX7RC52_9GAMM|nr:hypothetical protein [Lysobacter arenosi]QSX75600.1 hypothetical protein HIV01_003450 [Lysobacter arenosi]